MERDPGTQVAADLARLREQLAELARENAALRDELRSELRAQALPVSPGAARGVEATASAQRRRVVGRVISAALLAAGFGLGVWFAQSTGSDVVRGYRENYDPRATTAPPAPTPAPVATPVPPAAPVAPVAPAP